MKTLYFDAEFSDIGWMPVRVNTYRADTKKAIADYIERMKNIGVTVLKTANAHFA